MKLSVYNIYSLYVHCKKHHTLGKTSLKWPQLAERALIAYDCFCLKTIHTSWFFFLQCIDSYMHVEATI